MIQLVVQNDTILAMSNEDIAYLGVHYDHIKNGTVETLPENYDGWFPFMPMCFSIGDLGIRSGIFEALKTKYPNIKIAFPKTETLEYIFKTNGNPYTKQVWDISFRINELITPEENLKNVMMNNPHIDYYFDVGDFDMIYTDHDRSYTNLEIADDGIRSIEEPLAEQILRRFGFNDNDIKTIDSRPKLYFTEEEIAKGNSIIEKYTGKDYGCLLFSARVETYKHKWETEHYLYEHAERLKDTPVFFYSLWDLKDSVWDKYFPNRFDFKELGLSIREQLYIRQNSKFQLGYQSGMVDATSGKNSEVINLSPYPSIRENRIKGAKYIFNDGRTL